jgi:hypothetical protein
LSSTRELLVYVDKGEFDLSQYATVFHYIIRFNNPLRLNIDKLVKRFRNGIIKGKNSYKHQALLKVRLSLDESVDYYNELKKIVVFCNEINDEIKIKEDSSATANIFNLFKTDFSAFCEKMNYSEFRFSPIFVQMKFGDIWRIIKSMKNSDTIEFAFYLEERYKPQIYEGILIEKKFLSELIKKVEAQINNSKINKMKRIAYEFLRNKISQSMMNFS